MPRSIYIVPKVENITWDGPYEEFGPTKTATYTSKLLYINSSGDMEWVSFDNLNISNLESYADSASFPVTGESAVLYFAQDTKLWYRWTGSVYENAFTQYLAKSDDTATSLRLEGTTSLAGNITVSGTRDIGTVNNLTTTQLNSVTIPANLALVHVVEQTWNNIGGQGSVEVAWPGGTITRFITADVSYYHPNASAPLAKKALQKEGINGSNDNKWCLDESSNTQFDYNLPAAATGQITIRSYWCQA